MVVRVSQVVPQKTTKLNMAARHLLLRLTGISPRMQTFIALKLLVERAPYKGWLALLIAT